MQNILFNEAMTGQEKTRINGIRSFWEGRIIAETMKRKACLNVDYL